MLAEGRGRRPKKLFGSPEAEDCQRGKISISTFFCLFSFSLQKNPPLPPPPRPQKSEVEAGEPAVTRGANAAETAAAAAAAASAPGDLDNNDGSDGEGSGGGSEGAREGGSTPAEAEAAGALSACRK